MSAPRLDVSHQFRRRVLEVAGTPEVLQAVSEHAFVQGADLLGDALKMLGSI
ncbi:MAG: hypothetical protein WBA45_15410 [Microthrixaceae bacterium]